MFSCEGPERFESIGGRDTVLAEAGNFEKDQQSKRKIVTQNGGGPTTLMVWLGAKSGNRGGHR